MLCDVFPELDVSASDATLLQITLAIVIVLFVWRSFE